MEILSSIEDLGCRPDGSKSIIHKNGISFCEVEKDQISLIHSSGSYIEIDNNILRDKDKFLKSATKAYWIAKDRKKKTQSVEEVV